MERSYDVIQAFREASRTDPDAAADHRRILDRRARSLRRFIATLEPHLAPRISPRTATDMLWAFSNEELYRELVVERGWSADRFEQWLASILRAQLLGERIDTNPSARREFAAAHSVDLGRVQHAVPRRLRRMAKRTYCRIPDPW
jgi:hypothetical protein